MLLPVLRQTAVLVAPVHGLGLYEVLAFVAAVVEEDFVDQLRAVEGAVVGQEGIVVGLADERAGAGKDRVDGEAAGLEAVDIGEVAAAILYCERAAADAVALRGVDDPHRVVHALHQRHVGVLARALAHGAAHTSGVAEKEQVARQQRLSLCHASEPERCGEKYDAWFLHATKKRAVREDRSLSFVNLWLT